MVAFLLFPGSGGLLGEWQRTIFSAHCLSPLRQPTTFRRLPSTYHYPALCNDQAARRLSRYVFDCHVPSGLASLSWGFSTISGRSLSHAHPGTYASSYPNDDTQLRPLRRRRRGAAADRRADAVLRPLPAARRRRSRSARRPAWKACCAKSSRSRATTRRSVCDYIKYELGKPRYGPDECRQLRLTYGRPFRVWLRLNKEQPVEEEVYLGDMPIMIGGGEFIINGAERVVVSQLHRSPGVDFVVETEAGDRKLHCCRIIPERGSWIEINVTKKDTLGVRIDQSGKFSAMTLLRGHGPDLLHQRRHPPGVLPNARTSSRDAGQPRRAWKAPSPSDDVIDPETGEVYLDSGEPFTKEVFDKIIGQPASRKSTMLRSRTIRASTRSADPRLAQGRPRPSTHEEALLKIYQRLRPGQSAAARKGQGAVPARSSRTPTAIGWARSAASASTASSTRTFPNRK